MAAKQSSLRTKKKKPKDLCPICDKNLYLNSDFTQRIGLIDSEREVTGWICPECSSEFDLTTILCIFTGRIQYKEKHSATQTRTY